MFLATILLISAEAASKDKDEKFNSDGNHVHKIFINNCPIGSNMHIFFLWLFIYLFIFINKQTFKCILTFHIGPPPYFNANVKY